MIAHRNILKDLGRVIFWFPLRWFVNLAPFSFVYRIGGILGYVDYLFSGPKRRDKMAKNISRVFSGDPKQFRKIIINNLKTHCRNVLEFIKYSQLRQDNLSDLLSFEGLDFLDRELAKGKGVVLATGHFGAKQLLQLGLGYRGYKVSQVHYHMSRDELTFIQKKVSQRQRIKIEEKIPVKFIGASGFLRPAYTSLKQNQVLIIAADGVGLPEHMKKGYSPFPFLGKRMLFPINVASLAIRTGASIVPAFVIREGIQHQLVIEPAIEVGARSSEEIVGDFVEILEKYVQRYPHLWEFWEEFDEDTLITSR
ncbi:MAG: lysophospholipid acyltransferase family protein [Thermoplasmata archaeon]|nr:MAG: lysophospholipid acyltransferase family protein [Thermoplasmata archaeon]